MIEKRFAYFASWDSMTDGLKANLRPIPIPSEFTFAAAIIAACTHNLF